MVKKIILYIISIAVFLFVFFKLTNYVLAVNTDIGKILSGEATSIQIANSVYNNNKHVFCVSNNGEHKYNQDVTYNLKYLIKFEGKTATVEYSANNQTTRKI